MHGLHGEYPGDGFVLDLPTNLTGAQTRLAELQSWQWIDERTRAFIIELSTLNHNVNTFVHSRILFEFPATGGGVLSQEAFPFRALQLSLPLMFVDDLSGNFVYFVETTALHIMLFSYMCFLMYKNGAEYFMYFWSIVDCIIVLIFLILIISMFATFGAVSSMPQMAPEVIADPEAFFPIGHIVPKLEYSSSTLAALGLMCWVKILKYFSLIVIFEAVSILSLEFAQSLLLKLFDGFDFLRDASLPPQLMPLLGFVNKQATFGLQDRLP